MLANERLDLVHQCRALAERKLGLDPLLERGETKLLQPRTLLLENPPVSNVGKRRTPPERQRLAQARNRERWIAGSKRLSALVAQTLEALEVELVRLDPEAVSGRLSDQALACDSGGCEPTAQARDVDLDHLRRALGRRVLPEQVGQPVGRDPLVSVQQQNGQQDSLLARP